MNIAELVSRSARRFPDRQAVCGPDAELTYAELDRAADAMAARLRAAGVGRGDRVAIWMEKSARAVAAMQGALRAGAVYVPIDAMNPAPRCAAILRDCTVRALVTTKKRAGLLADLPPGANVVLLDSLAPLLSAHAAAAPDGDLVEENELAYILYTSGSTGCPKGVCITHRNALAFVEWACEEIRATAEDRFSCHASFSFDLTVLDLYGAFLCGASVHLVAETTAWSPAALVEFLAARRISVWYSVPSAWMLMMDHGSLAATPLPHLRTILFAGEPFPAPALRRLMSVLPEARYLNLYGPTETNVCTWWEVPAALHGESVPIGKACSGDYVYAVKPDGSLAKSGEEGELWVAGPTVMAGYWGRAAHEGPYRTGDLVRLLDDGNYLYLGRLDHMAKVRGHRIEAGEVEAALLKHPAVREAAVLVVGKGMQARLVACLAVIGLQPGLLEIKRHCASLLPRYMIVDDTLFFPRLPRTANGKVDRALLLAECTQEEAFALTSSQEVPCTPTLLKKFSTTSQP